MSKVVYFFRYLLIASSLALVLLVIQTGSVYALQTFPGDITIDYNPKPIFINSGSVTFTVTAARDNTFSPNQEFSYIAWLDGSTHRGVCPSSNSSQRPDSTGKQLVFTWTLPGGGCRDHSGLWHFVMWRGTTDINSTSPASIIIPDYPFVVEQAGGSLPQIIPVKTPLGVSETPQVNLINARSDNTYEFWWAGSKTEFAASKIKPSNDGNILIDLAKNGVDFRTAEQKTLCMEIGDHIWPTSINCSFSTTFEFTNIPPPPPTGQPECSIEPPNPLHYDSISIKAKNVPLNQKFKADLMISGGQTIKSSDQKNPDNSGIVILNLIDHISAGNYTAKVYDTNNTTICSKDFTVPLPGTLPSPSTTACTDPAKCTSGGGQKIKGCSDPEDPSYDPKHPGIATAIGCIHTNPAELVKDFMTFVIGIGGGLAFLMMILGAFQMLTSAGNPETLQAGRDRLTSAVIGLLFIIFAVLLLQIIGVDILKIPGFGR